MNTDPNLARLCPGCFADKGAANPCPHCGFDEQAARPAQALALRTLLNGQFLIGRVLGKPGGFGITYLGWDLQLQTPVAIKEYLPRDLAVRAPDGSSILPHTAEEDGLFRYGLEQFLAEARTLARMDHPNIVRVRQFFEANRSAYLVMDYYRGASLAEHLERLDPRGGPGRLNERKALTLMQPILDGLRAVHAKGFLHRDVKPQNIYLAQTDSGGVRPILLDFGAARQAVGERSRSLSVVISPGYAPFEQYHRKGAQGPPTDIYGAAAVLYRMLTGETPPEATERMADDTLKPAAAFGISQSVSDAIGLAMALEASDRPQTVLAFQERLCPESLNTESSATASSSLEERALPTEKAYRKTWSSYGRGIGAWRWISLAGLFAIMVVLGVGIWSQLYFPWQDQSALLEAQQQREEAQLEAERVKEEAHLAELRLQREMADLTLRAQTKDVQLEQERRHREEADARAEVAIQRGAEEMRLQTLRQQREEAERTTTTRKVEEGALLAETRRQQEMLEQQRKLEEALSKERRRQFDSSPAAVTASRAEPYPREYAHIWSPSYGCTGRLSDLERLICDTPSLARADGIMGAVYRELRTMLTPERFKQILRQQRVWIKKRNSDCAGANAAACILSMTEKRIVELLSVKHMNMY